MTRLRIFIPKVCILDHSILLILIGYWIFFCLGRTYVYALPPVFVRGLQQGGLRNIVVCEVKNKTLSDRDSLCGQFILSFVIY